MTPSDIEAIRQRVENAQRMGCSHSDATDDCAVLLAELDRRGELMREAADRLNEEWFGGIFYQCCGSAEHTSDCLIEQLRAVGK